jgi:hypothetical protein
MKSRKNVEAVFLAIAVMSAFAVYATAKVDAPRETGPAAAKPFVADNYMQVVVIKAKRLTAAEKAALN